MAHSSCRGSASQSEEAATHGVSTIMPAEEQVERADNLPERPMYKPRRASHTSA